MLPAAAKALLGFARRAGTVALGREAVADALRRRSACLVILAADAGAATERRFTALAESVGTPVVRCGGQDELGAALGTTPKSVCAVTSDEIGRGLQQALAKAEVSIAPQGGAGAGACPGNTRTQ